ncbi:MAG: GNAT family N-acetyltransferase [Sphingobacteriales bacterium]|nr:MAG: GNAT family N-acetyltransferase [Sphingobacteriales bacterium]
MPEFIYAKTKDEYAAAADLFKEYAAWLNIDLCFQNFDAELQQLDKMYALPHGGIILCKEQEHYIGCVGIRKIDNESAEMKRMWIKTDQHGQGPGSALLQKAIELAKICGYKKIKLDTLNTMTPAINLYIKNGFIEIPSYYNNPDSRAMYFEKSI